jgi:hypothetical protein
MWIAIVVIVLLLGGALVWMARKAKQADEELADMNKGRQSGAGVFGIFNKDHRNN